MDEIMIFTFQYYEILIYPWNSFKELILEAETNKKVDT